MYIDHTSATWARNKDKIVSQLILWGYHMNEMATRELDADGYLHRYFEDGQMASERVAWKKDHHWEWLLENAPLEEE